MGSPSDLLDELARVYARVAVEEFLARTKHGVAEESRHVGGTLESPVPPPAAPETPK